MVKTALALSCVAVLGAGFAVWKTACPSCGAKPANGVPPSDGAEGLAARFEAIERRLDALENAPRPTGATPAPGVSPSADVGPGLATTAERAAGAAATPAEVATTLEEVTRRLAALEDARKKDEATAASLPRMARVFGPGGGAVLASTEDAQRQLELTDGQKAELDRIVADARRDLEALRKIPDEEGKTWEQVQREMVTEATAAVAGGGAMRLDPSKFLSFRSKTVPGRTETYGQADRRIRDDATRRMRDTLTRDQQEKFDRVTVDPMIGGGPGLGAATVMFASPDAKPPK